MYADLFLFVKFATENWTRNGVSGEENGSESVYNL